MKKTIFLVITFIGITMSGMHAQVAINTDNSEADASAILDVKSTEKGFLPPRMTTAQRDAISSPAEGLIIYNTDEHGIEFWNGTTWYNPSATPIVPLAPFQSLIGGNDQESASSIAQSSDGSIIVVGESESSANGDVTDANHGGKDIWIVKMDDTGAIIWDKLYGGSGFDIAGSVVVTSDGGCIILGSTTSSANGNISGTNHGGLDYWVIKLDADGAINWEKLYGGSASDEATSIQQTSDGGYIIAGNSSSSANGDISQTNNGQADYWVVKLDVSGNITWEKLFGGSYSESLKTIIQTADGGYLLGGRTASSTSGNVTGTSNGGNDYWIVKIDASGTLEWQNLYGGSDGDEPYDLIQTSDGGYMIAGISSSSNGDVSGTNHGSGDIWILSLDASGNINWNKLFGGSAADYAMGIHETLSGDIVVGGYSRSSANGDVTDASNGVNDYWVFKMDNAGTAIIWDKLYGGNLDEYSRDCISSIDGGIIIAGKTNSSANGDVTGTNHQPGVNDIWIVKLDADGAITW